MKMVMIKYFKNSYNEFEIPEFRLSEEGAKALAERLNNPPPPSERVLALFGKDKEFKMEIPDKPFSKEFLALAEKVVKAQKKIKEPTDEMIARAADWIVNSSFGEE